MGEIIKDGIWDGKKLVNRFLLLLVPQTFDEHNIPPRSMKPSSKMFFSRADYLPPLIVVSNLFPGLHKSCPNNWAFKVDAGDWRHQILHLRSIPHRFWKWISMNRFRFLDRGQRADRIDCEGDEM